MKTPEIDLLTILEIEKMLEPKGWVRVPDKPYHTFQCFVGEGDDSIYRRKRERELFLALQMFGYHLSPKLNPSSITYYEFSIKELKEKEVTFYRNYRK